MSQRTLQSELENMISQYLDNNKKEDKHFNYHELEVKFGTKGLQNISKINFDNVFKKLKSIGFDIQGTSAGDNMLRIQNEYSDDRSQIRISNIRTEIYGLHNISEYCKSNRVDGDSIVKFNQKMPVKNGENEIIRTVDYNDFNFRVSYNMERNIQKHAPIIKKTIEDWSNTKKLFRLINRVRLSHPDLPAFVDMSIVKSSKKSGNRIQTEYTMDKADIQNAPCNYEIEIEVDNKRLLNSYKYKNISVVMLADILKKVAKFILSGLQETNYPISYPEIQTTQLNYMKLLHGEKFESRRIIPRDFIGPSSYTLQVNNIAPINENVNVPNIRQEFTVTDKADGTRKLLYINDKGKIYLIDTNMNIQFTGVITNIQDNFNSLIDGEHILHNREGNYINLYAAFDVYYLKGKSVRTLEFIPTNEEFIKTNYRLPLLTDLVKGLNMVSVVKDGSVSMRVEVKKFYVEDQSQTIFNGCKYILTKNDETGFEYNIDGLIFTPAKLGVGSNVIGKAGPLMKITWEHSFKWKPTDQNTIDFLVSYKKDQSGKIEVNNIFENGVDTSSATQLTQYKTLVLRVGFDEDKHGYINPCQDVYDDKVSNESNGKRNDYKPMPFYPTNPSDNSAHLCNIELNDHAGIAKAFTEDKEVIEDNTIIEFKYDITKQGNWKWIPIRVRYDKTNELRSGFKNYGNAYHVANSNWHTIHNPITPKMMSGIEDIPDELADDDIYYTGLSANSLTKPMRDFHNLFVKKMLITSTSKKGNTLIDYAVGKGGDFPKWIESGLSFVFGIDIAKDNIENRLNGACTRYLNYKKQFKSIPSALFVAGNSSLNIRSGAALSNDKSKQISKAVFGQGPKDETMLGKGVYNAYGKGREGFNISSCQFALHYFFESTQTLQSFLENVSECTKKNGYFIGTAYDGKSLFNMLKPLEKGQSKSLYVDEAKIWEITKEYENQAFSNDMTSIGYAINVYQETIGKPFREYLINFEYLNRLMENYGFVLMPTVDAKKLGLPSSSGMFSTLFTQMERAPNKYKRIVGKAFDMSIKEKQISFLNRYFVYKKVRDVDIRGVSLSLENKVSIAVDKEDTEPENNKQDETVNNNILLEESEVLPTKQNPIKIEESVKLNENNVITDNLPDPTPAILTSNQSSLLKEASEVLNAKKAMEDAYKDEAILNEKEADKVSVLKNLEPVMKTKSKKSRKKIKIISDSVVEAEAEPGTGAGAEAGASNAPATSPKTAPKSKKKSKKKINLIINDINKNK